MNIEERNFGEECNSSEKQWFAHMPHDYRFKVELIFFIPCLSDLTASVDSLTRPVLSEAVDGVTSDVFVFISASTLMASGWLEYLLSMHLPPTLTHIISGRRRRSTHSSSGMAMTLP